MQLSETTLRDADAALPHYDRTVTSVGIVHLGLGAFARAHLATYVDDLLATGHRDLAILGVSLRNADVADALNPQDGLYTVGEIDGSAVRPRVIGSVRRVVHEPTEPQRVRDALAAPTTTVITVTVTEKGYCTDPASHRLDLRHPDVLHDLRHPDAPRSLPGQLLRAMRDRRDLSSGPVTVLSLDNLPANGQTLRAVVLDLARASDTESIAWIEDHVRFPSSMVDRMVPATDQEFRTRIAELVGLDDHWPVRCEPFRQWVVERDWATPLPPLESVGVTVVDDVAPWERTKLRVLNALHTAAAHYGLRHGLETVDAVTNDAGGRRLLDRLAVEIAEVLEPPAGLDLGEYIAATLARFRNDGLHHRCAQIATDTSQKLPQRLLDTLRLRLERELPVDALADTLALWAWSTLGRDHRGARREVNDPLRDTYARLADSVGRDATELVSALLALEQVFGDLAHDRSLAALVSSRLSGILGTAAPR